MLALARTNFIVTYQKNEQILLHLGQLEIFYYIWICKTNNTKPHYGL